MKPRCAIYLRASVDKDGDRLAVDRQETKCRAVARERGWTVVGTYSDNNVSATNRDVKRPEYDRLERDYAAGHFDAIVCHDLDRLTRRPRQLEDWIDAAEDKGLVLVTANGEADLSTDNGRMFARIKAAVARGEIERKSDRQRAANRQRAERGVPMAGGPRTVGYEVGLTAVRQSEAELIRAAYSTVVAGGSLRSIARAWNDAGMTTWRGGRWDSTSVRTCLRNPRYAGLSAYRARTTDREILAAGQWPALVTTDVWEAVQHVLDDPDRRTTPDTARRYLLSGQALCGRCGATVQSGRTQHGIRTYRCSARPGHLSRSADAIDAFVLDVITARLAEPDAADLMSADDTDKAGRALQDERKALRLRLNQLVDSFTDGKVTQSQLNRGTARVERRLKEIAAALAGDRRSAVLAPVLAPGAFMNADLDMRRAVVDVLAVVTLLSPGRGARTFDPDSVRIDWR